MKLVSAYARGVMINSLIDDARELAIARTMHRASPYVLVASEIDVMINGPIDDARELAMARTSPPWMPSSPP